MRYLVDHYDVRLLWKCDDIVLPNNSSMAVTCLNRLGKHLLNEPHLLAKYQAYIEKMVDGGQAVFDKDDGCVPPRTSYLIHHCMSGKFRVVMNGIVGLKEV